MQKANIFYRDHGQNFFIVHEKRVYKVSTELETFVALSGLSGMIVSPVKLHFNAPNLAKTLKLSELNFSRKL